MILKFRTRKLSILKHPLERMQLGPYLQERKIWKYYIDSHLSNYFSSYFSLHFFQAGSTHVMNNNYLQEGRGVCSRLQQRPIDLQFPSSHNIKNASGALLKNGNNLDSSDKSIELMHHSCGNNVF